MSSSSQPIRVAVVGNGLSAKVFHLPFLNSLPADFQVKVLISRTATPGVEAGVQTSNDFEAALAPNVDLVVITTPNKTHFPMAKQALERGKHVVVEKPFTVTVEEALELTRLAEKAGKCLAVYQNRRLDGDFLTVRELVESKACGRLTRFYSRYDRFRPTPKVRT
jgi:predicted dehydrogenase